MITIVGIFDNDRDMDRAVTRLAEEGFDDTLYDDGLVADAGSGAGATFFVPHFGQAMTWETRERTPRKRSQSSIVQAFKEHLAEHHLSDDIIQGYAVTFYHDGKFALVRTNAKKADAAITVMEECGATRVNRHG